MDKPESHTVPSEVLTQLDEALADLKIESEVNSQPQQNEPKEEMDFLDEVLQGTHDKLNLTADEKEDLDDLDDEEIQNEYAEFMRSMANNQNANDILGQLSKLMESGIGSDFDMNGDLGNLLGDFGDGAGMDAFTDTLIGQFINKEVIFEPLKEARKKVEEHINANQANKTDKNIKVLQILNDILELMESDAQNTAEGKDKIMQLFEELQDQGGLPEEIVKDDIASNPELSKLQGLTQGSGCVIF